MGSIDEPDDSSERYEEAIDPRYQRLVESLRDYAVFLLAPDATVVSWNPGAELMKGYARDEIIGQHFSVFYTPEAIAVGHPESELGIARATGAYAEEGWRIRKDGTRFWASVLITAMYDAGGQLEGYGKVIGDLTARKQAEEQAANTLALLRKTANTDPLTGALNRRALDEALESLIRQAGPFCVAMIDIDEFKQLNDRLGHAAGDLLLRQMSSAWADSLREGDLLARYGGDEFVALLPSCELSEGRLAAERLRSVTPSRPCSVGVAAWEPGVSVDELFSQADAALYRNKGLRRDAVAPNAAEAPTGRR